MRFRDRGRRCPLQRCDATPGRPLCPRLLAALALSAAVVSAPASAADTAPASTPAAVATPTTPSSTAAASKSSAPKPSASSSAKRPATGAGTRAQLQSVRSQIDRVKQQAVRAARERDRLNAQLRDVELALEQSADTLERINAQISDYDARRLATEAQAARQDRALSTARGQLADATRAAYALERSSPLELWLSERSPSEQERLQTYYGYFGRAMAERIGRLQTDVRQLGGIADQLAQQQARLAELKQSQEQTQQQLGHQRDQRQQVLLQLGTAERSRTEQLARLTSEQADLERVLKNLTRASATRPAPAAPDDLTSAFGRLRGQLLWPVSGQVTAAYGDQRASGVAWDGMVIATPRDSPVRAVSAGRVAYADWLPGLGLLVIVDHGEGYLSLYGHNDRLFKAVGTTVNAGDVIAAAGDTGGRAQPELYFEIRRGGKPVDPRPWFKSAQPPPPPP
jgi:septal ring factor EnvC (AmiA/AmiB activator)